MDLNAIKRKLFHHKADVNHQREIAEKLTDNLSPKSLEFIRRFKIFSEFPDDIDEINTEIDNIRAHIDCLVGTDDQVNSIYLLFLNFLRKHLLF